MYFNLHNCDIKSTPNLLFNRRPSAVIFFVDVNPGWPLVDHENRVQLWPPRLVGIKNASIVHPEVGVQF